MFQTTQQKAFHTNLQSRYLSRNMRTTNQWKSGHHTTYKESKSASRQGTCLTWRCTLRWNLNMKGPGVLVRHSLMQCCQLQAMRHKLLPTAWGTFILD